MTPFIVRSSNARELAITVFHTDDVEKLVFDEVAKQAEVLGYRVAFSQDFDEPTDIALTASSQVRPTDAKLRLIGLHGLDQGRFSRPNFWADENWANFDVGLLPGRNWARNWQQAGWNPNAHPKLGVFINGWPKSDPFLSKDFERGKEMGIKELELRLPPGKRILYAPGAETDGKQFDVMRATQKLGVSLMVKHWPGSWDSGFLDLAANISDANWAAENEFDHVRILDPALNVLEAISLSEVVVTDESTVSLEAALLGKPTISVKDWTMRISNSSPPRPVRISPDIGLVAEKSNLAEKISLALSDPLDYIYDATQDVSFQGEATLQTLSIIENAWANKFGDLYGLVLPSKRPNKILYVFLEKGSVSLKDHTKRALGIMRKSLGVN